MFDPRAIVASHANPDLRYMQPPFLAVTSEDLQPYRELAHRYATEHPEQSYLYSIGNADRMLETPPDYPASLPRFAAWLVENNLVLDDTAPAVPPVDSTPLLPAFTAAQWQHEMSEEQRELYRAELLAYVPNSRWAYYTPGDIGSIIADRTGFFEHENYVIGEFATALANGSHVITTPATPTEVAPPTPTQEATITLPTSPRAAFPTREAFVTTYERWIRDTDPRLPDQMSLSGNTYLHSTFGTYTNSSGEPRFMEEVERGLTGDTFTSIAGSYLSDYALGFWRDVRDLGYGTAFWDQATVPPVDSTPGFDPDMTAAQLQANARPQLALIRELWLEWNAGPGTNPRQWAEWMSAPGTAGEWAETDPASMWLSDYRRFLEWLRLPENRSRMTDAVPPVDSTTVRDIFSYTAAEFSQMTEPHLVLAPYAAGVREWQQVDGKNPDWVDALLGEAAPGRGFGFGSGRFGHAFTELTNYIETHPADFTLADPTGTATTAPTQEAAITDPVIIPIGPEHPGWMAFAAECARIASENSMCPEYDRIARAVGLPTRKERLTFPVTINVTVDVERGHNANVRQLREAAKALLEKPGTIANVPTATSREQVVA